MDRATWERIPSPGFFRPHRPLPLFGSHVPSPPYVRSAPLLSPVARFFTKTSFLRSRTPMSAAPVPDFHGPAKFPSHIVL